MSTATMLTDEIARVMTEVKQFDEEFKRRLLVAASAARRLASAERALSNHLRINSLAAAETYRLRAMAYDAASALAVAADAIGAEGSATRARTEARNLRSPRGIVTADRCRDVASRWEAIAKVWAPH